MMSQSPKLAIIFALAILATASAVSVEEIPRTTRLSAQDRDRTAVMRDICIHGYEWEKLRDACGSRPSVFRSECWVINFEFATTISRHKLEGDVRRGCPSSLRSIDKLEDFANRSGGDCKKYKNKCDDNDDGGRKETNECFECVKKCLSQYRNGRNPVDMATALFCGIQATAWPFREV